MKLDLQNNLKHAGAIFVGAVKKSADAAVNCSKDLFESYDIIKLRNQEQLLSRQIGERVTQLIRDGITYVSQDTLYAELVAKLKVIEQELVQRAPQGSTILNLFKAKTTACGCASTCEGKEQL